ncbi:MAG: TrbI/VirB10 family protein [Pseudomonadota bacterium]
MSNSPPVKRYRVSRMATKRATWPVALALLGIGTGVFAGMADSRSGSDDPALGLPPLATTRMTAPTGQVNPAEAQVAAPFVVRASAAPPAQAISGASTYLPAIAIGEPQQFRNVPRGSESFGGTTLVLDLFSGRGGQRLPSNPGLGQEQEQIDGAAEARRAAGSYDPTGDAIAAAGPAPLASPQGREGTGNERFANRVSSRANESSQARRMSDLDRLVPQGAIVGAVMETALNSDVPGYARAVVTKDILSFDGSAVLIPAGSRIVGEYNSGVAQGASRIFIVWSRLIRPDGVSIALGSPATDELGRGGLGGKVNRHFLQRFGSAILLSVLTGGISAASAAVSRGSTIIVGTSNEATTLATQALQGNDIPPTIKTNQGALVRVFVARDLDFSAVGPAG